jgi:hypothetical protein
MSEAEAFIAGYQYATGNPHELPDSNPYQSSKDDEKRKGPTLDQIDVDPEWYARYYENKMRNGR